MKPPSTNAEPVNEIQLNVHSAAYMSASLASYTL